MRHEKHKTKVRFVLFVYISTISTYVKKYPVFRATRPYLTEPADPNFVGELQNPKKKIHIKQAPKIALLKQHIETYLSLCE